MILKRHRVGMAATAITAAAMLGLAGCASSTPEDSTSSPSEGEELIPVTLQLQWLMQSQFAGYIVADVMGYYEEEGLDVTIVEGGGDIVPQNEVAQGNADFAVSWMPKALASLEQGAELTNIAQTFSRSGMTQITWADSGVDSVADFAGNTVGTWGYGNEIGLFAAMIQEGVDPNTDSTLVTQAFDMNGFLDGEITAAQAMTYNELAVVLETINPETGELFQLDDLNVFAMEDVIDGGGLYEDGLWANSQRLEDEEFQDVTTKFLKASAKGWVYARDYPEETVEIVQGVSTGIGDSHQMWMLNETSKLVWPVAGGWGLIDEEKFAHDVAILLKTTDINGAPVITTEPPSTAYTTEYLEAALAELEAEGIDVTGESWTPQELELTEGGQ